MQDEFGVDKYMNKVAVTIRKYHKQPSDEFTDIYNRAWEAVYNALKETSQQGNATDGDDTAIGSYIPDIEGIISGSG